MLRSARPSHPGPPWTSYARTVAVDLDPPSLLSRLAASVPPPKLHTVRYAVLAPASKLRARIVPTPVAAPANDTSCAHGGRSGGSHYRPWAES